MSLRVRIGAVAGLAVAVTVLLAAVAVYVAVRSNLRGEVERSLVARAQSVVHDDRRGGPGPGPGGRRPGRRGGPGNFGRPPRGERFGGAEGYVQRLDPSGEILRPPGAEGTLPVSAATRAIAGRGSGAAFEDVDVDDTHLLVLSAADGAGGAVQVARPLTEVDSVLSRVLAVLLVIGAAGIALAAALGAGVARYALAPVTRFTRHTEAIAARPYLTERMEVVGTDELARLAQSFNATLEALEAAVAAQRQLVADASHELRTPIASLRANIQTLEHADRLPAHELAALRADIVSELDELTALVADVVELARGTKPSAELDDIRLDDVVRALVERAERRGDRPVRFHATLAPTLVQGEPERVARAVSNLLDNARKWSPEGAAVDVTLSDGVLEVRDRGPGFAPEDLPHVFDRFYRAAAARTMSGSGLGLAIVRQAAEAHGGWVEAANSEDGGAIVRVRFSPTG